MDREGQHQATGRPSILTDPEGYMRDFEQRIATMRSHADGMQEKLAEVSARVECEEAEVAVTVNVGGALADIEFGPGVRHMSGAALADAILRTYRQAAAEASEKAVEAMSELFGSDSETTRFVRQAVNRQRAPEED